MWITIEIAPWHYIKVRPTKDGKWAARMAIGGSYVKFAGFDHATREEAEAAARDVLRRDLENRISEAQNVLAALDQR